ncbi:hypothetical protein QUF72_21710 [Desulfobacterales bacterium HSG2]|nr:hypothetical protein [Desulfobacterales bacterium HSG2]
MQHICKKTLILLFLSVFIWGTAWAETISISFEKEKLTADIKDAPLKKVLQKLSDECGASVYMDESIPEKNVTVKFKGIPVEEAVKRLVVPFNSAVIFSQEQGKKTLSVSSIKVFQKGKPGKYVDVRSSVIDSAKVKTKDSEKAEDRIEDPAKEFEKARDRIEDPRVRKVFDMLTKTALEIGELKKDISRSEESLSSAKTDKEKRKIRKEISKKKKAIKQLEKTAQKQMEEQAEIIRSEKKSLK